MKTKKSNNNGHNGKISADALLAKAAAAKKLAKAARNHLEMVRAEHKQARKAFKQAKRAAKRARKEVKIAAKMAKMETRKPVRTVKVGAKPIRHAHISSSKETALPRVIATSHSPMPATAPAPAVRAGAG